VQSTKHAGQIQIEAVKEDVNAPELMPAKIVIKTRAVAQRPAVALATNRG
jgi:hypothetical protein